MKNVRHFKSILVEKNKRSYACVCVGVCVGGCVGECVCREGGMCVCVCLCV